MSQNLQPNNKEAVLRDGSLFISVPIETVPTNLPLPYPLYVFITDRYVLFRQEGDTLTEQRAVTLSRGTQALFVPKVKWNAWFEFLEESVNKGSASSLQELIEIRHLLMAHQQWLEQNSLEISASQIAKIQSLSDMLASFVHKNPNVGTKLLQRFTDPKLYFANHVINVAIYGAAVATKHTLSLPQVKMITLAALFHNIGNIFVPKEVLFKPAELTRLEFDLIQEHPEKGARLLEKFKLPREVVLTAREHHERVDGQGYPHKRRGEDIHLFSKICSIADVYDALTSTRPYRAGLDPQAAVEQMRAMLGKFDPHIIKMIDEN